MGVYEVFKDIGKGAPVPEGYKNIRVHLVFDCKHDGRRHGRLVADGHLTDIPVDSVYSGVVSLRGFRLLLFLAELNGLDIWGTDISSAYLEAHTKEKVCIMAGPEFGPLAKHRLIISRSLYGLRSSGKMWNEKFSECMMLEGFTPCRADPEIWMRKNDDIYEYVAVYVDDLAFAVKDPKQFVKNLQQNHGFKVKGTGPLEFHLGANFERDEDGTLCMSPKKYICDRLIPSYQKMFGEKPKTKAWSPLEQNDHPELDDSELLDDTGIQQYQSLIGALQWIISLGRYDIQCAVMSMSSFRVAPRKGHLERLKRICGYISKFQDFKIRFRTHLPDFSDLSPDIQSWESIYGNPKEILPHDMPKPLGKSVQLTHYVDANLYHDALTGRSVTACLHFVNGTPIEWWSKKQATVETATYSSEFVAARTCVEQIIDLRNTLRYLGVPIIEKSIMFGDNESVVKSSTSVYAKLHKRHTALSFHRVREAIASKYLAFNHLPGKENPADILSKHWSFNAVKDQLLPLFNTAGETMELMKNEYNNKDN